MKMYDTDKIRELCRKYKGWDDREMREELIRISRGRREGNIEIVGEDGADRDDAISKLTRAIGGPW
jgi:hypothetical protein